MADNDIIARFLDAAEEPARILLPIEGYEKEPLLPLEQAVQPIRSLLHDLDKMVWIAKQNSHDPSDGLSPDESAAIHLYTMQWDQPYDSLYTLLNQTLRSEVRDGLKPWFCYLKLLLTALYKLPSIQGTIYRGIRENLSDQYKKHQSWWGLSSCTETIQVIEQFVGSAPVRTIFLIECINGKSIGGHSFFKKENEILLMPGTYLQVVSKWNAGSGLHMIQLRETTPPYQLIASPLEPGSKHNLKTVIQMPDLHVPVSVQYNKLSKLQPPFPNDQICQFNGCSGTLYQEGLVVSGIILTIPLGTAYTAMFAVGLFPKTWSAFVLGLTLGS